MQPRPKLKASIKKKIEENRTLGSKRNREFAERMQRRHEKNVLRWWYREGGKFFLDWVLDNYRTHRNEKLSLEEPFLAPYLKAIGNPWFVRILVLKGAQMGYTESVIAFIAFSLTAIRSSAMFCVEQNNKLLDMVAPRFQPAFSYTDEIQKLRNQMQELQGRNDTNTRQRVIEVGGVPVFFAYAGVGGSSSNDKAKRQVSSSLSSVPADLVVADEVEAFPAGAIDILYERTGASRLPTCPMRFGSTPGGYGGVVDAERRKSIHDFDWYVTCPNCHEGQFLEAFGSLFLPRTNEDGEQEYLDEIGNPIDWFAHDRSSLQQKVRTAYIGCKTCHTEIDASAIAEGAYRCRKTGKNLEKLGAEQLEKQEPITENICIRMPRLASFQFSASQRIARILRSSNKMDGWQQGFGIVVSLSGGRISWEKISLCVRELPKELQQLEEPDLVVLGIDQGVEHHWGVVQYWYWDEKAAEELRKLRMEGDEAYGDRERDRDLWATARKQVVWFGPLWGKDGIEKAAKKWRCDFVGMDAEPETELSSTMARRYRPNRSNGELPSPIRIPRGREWRQKNKNDPDLFSKFGAVFACDEVYLIAQDFKRQKREIQGEETFIFSIDRTVALDASKNRIHRKLCYFPLEWQNSDLTDKENFFYQLQASERFPDSSKDKMVWKAADGEPDHGHHADGFGEMAALMWNFVPHQNPFSFGAL